MMQCDNKSMVMSMSSRFLKCF